MRCTLPRHPLSSLAASLCAPKGMLEDLESGKRITFRRRCHSANEEATLVLNSFFIKKVRVMNYLLK